MQSSCTHEPYVEYISRESWQGIAAAGLRYSIAPRRRCSPSWLPRSSTGKPNDVFFLPAYICANIADMLLSTVVDSNAAETGSTLVSNPPANIGAVFDNPSPLRQAQTGFWSLNFLVPCPYYLGITIFPFALTIGIPWAGLATRGMSKEEGRLGRSTGAHRDPSTGTLPAAPLARIQVHSGSLIRLPISRFVNELPLILVAVSAVCVFSL